MRKNILNSLRMKKYLAFFVIAGLLVSSAFVFAETSTSTDQTATTTSTTTTTNATSTGATATTTATTTSATTTPSLPLISSPSASTTHNSATVKWNTDQNTSSQVEYGTTTHYGASTTPDTTLVANHSVLVLGLTPNSLYHFKVSGTNASGTMATSSDQTFTTLATQTGTTTATTTPSVESLQTLILQLQQMIAQLQQQVQTLIARVGSGTGTGTGTTTPNITSTISPNNVTVSKGESINFGGRNFGHEENITITLDGQTVATAHSDGGGNFSTGSISLPMTAGTKTYTFTGANGTMGSATVNVQ